MEDGFKVGDRVEAMCAYDENYSIVGKCGTIVKTHGDLYGIEFDDPISGHDLDGDIKTKNGWYVRSNVIIFCEDEEYEEDENAVSWEELFDGIT